MKTYSFCLFHASERVIVIECFLYLSLDEAISLSLFSVLSVCDQLLRELIKIDAVQASKLISDS